jgi:hypothetical protein
MQRHTQSHTNAHTHLACRRQCALTTLHHLQGVCAHGGHQLGPAAKDKVRCTCQVTGVDDRERNRCHCLGLLVNSELDHWIGNEKERRSHSCPQSQHTLFTSYCNHQLKQSWLPAPRRRYATAAAATTAAAAATTATTTTTATTIVAPAAATITTGAPRFEPRSCKPQRRCEHNIHRTGDRCNSKAGGGTESSRGISARSERTASCGVQDAASRWYRRVVVVQKCRLDVLIDEKVHKKGNKLRLNRRAHRLPQWRPAVALCVSACSNHHTNGVLSWLELCVGAQDVEWVEQQQCQRRGASACECVNDSRIIHDDSIRACFNEL